MTWRILRGPGLRGAAALFALLCAAGTSRAAVRTYVTEIPEILAQSPASDWETIADDDLIYLQLATGTVVIELAPFASPEHVAQWRALIRSGYYATSSIQRVQENYVVEWGESTGALSLGEVSAKLAGETTFAFTPAMQKAFLPLDVADTYAPHVGFIDAFPVGVDKQRRRAWIVHCHGVTGAVQDDPRTSPGGTYPYVAIGNPARELDGKIAVVGRVIEGIDRLTVLPRGQGVYGILDEKNYIPILGTRLASDVADKERRRFEQLRTGSKTFAQLLRVRRGAPSDSKGTGHPLHPVDICSIPLPVRPVTDPVATKH